MAIDREDSRQLSKRILCPSATAKVLPLTPTSLVNQLLELIYYFKLYQNFMFGVGPSTVGLDESL